VAAAHVQESSDWAHLYMTLWCIASMLQQAPCMQRCIFAGMFLYLWLELHLHAAPSCSQAHAHS
jgi:hypothetical protein